MGPRGDLLADSADGVLDFPGLLVAVWLEVGLCSHFGTSLRNTIIGIATKPTQSYVD